jgi:hypothetical protein
MIAHTKHKESNELEPLARLAGNGTDISVRLALILYCEGQTEELL